MLPKSRRLGAAEVRDVLRKGRSNKAILLSFKHMPGPLPLRAAVVVPKSVAKKATARNRIRRAVYRSLATLPGTGKGVVFVHKVPPPPLQAALLEELAILVKKHQ